MDEPEQTKRASGKPTSRHRGTGDCGGVAGGGAVAGPRTHRGQQNAGLPDVGPHQLQRDPAGAIGQPPRRLKQIGGQQRLVAGMTPAVLAAVIRGRLPAMPTETVIDSVGRAVHGIDHAIRRNVGAGIKVGRAVIVQVDFVDAAGDGDGDDAGLACPRRPQMTAPRPTATDRRSQKPDFHCCPHGSTNTIVSFRFSPGSITGCLSPLELAQPEADAIASASSGASLRSGSTNQVLEAPRTRAMVTAVIASRSAARWLFSRSLALLLDQQIDKRQPLLLVDRFGQ